ncbi:alpha/beta hydrolase [Natronosalvus rutilus]|uniref:Alpha/beta hydrolase n=1 Tax=Natronosalvus rutilus TaxID=2953753 RepID=A0A9E7SWJ4_9EURY|nr:alpha/beta hydrolase [Natronosalvus rutilus]UTF55122.1 alpha/beta hydrolase [Natronosalvus rutilus]
MGEDWEPFLAYNLERSRTPSVKASMRTMMKEIGVPTIPAADVERITVPTSLIWGRDDRAVRLEIAKDASACYGWPLRVIDDAGDDPKLEQPEAFLEALYEVLDDWLPIEG